MQAFLCKSNTEGYLGRDGKWTDDPAVARAFPTRFSARAYRAFHRLSDTQVIPTFRNGEAPRPGPARIRWSPPAARCKPGPILEARAELGPGHTLFVRGQGAGLSWQRGTPLLQVDPGTWIWPNDQPEEAVVCQLLLDDQIWAKGENLVLEAGDRVEIAPDFDWPEIPRTS
jgi:hypothetical protein